MGLAAGASAAAEERTENARRRRRGGGSGALYVPELGRADVRGGRRGGHRAHGRDKTQAILRGPRGRDHRVARHADSRRVASASPAHAFDADDAAIRVWDSGTGAMLFTATHESCGGA